MSKKKFIVPTLLLTTLTTLATVVTLNTIQAEALNAETEEVRIKKLPLVSRNNINLVLNKPAVAGLINASASNSISAEIDGSSAANAVDGDISTRWKTPSGMPDSGEKTLVVDLGVSKAVKSFKIDFENPNIKRFSIEGSNDNVNFEQITQNNTENETTKIINLEALSKSFKLYRLRITDWGPSVAGGDFNVGVNEFAIYEKNYVVDRLDLNNPNFALRRPTEASSSIEGKHPTFNAVDDKNVYFNSIWASKSESNWGTRIQGVPLNYFIVDLEEFRTISAFNVEFERSNILEFKIDVSSNKETWTTVYTSTTPKVVENLINLDSSYANVRFVRLRGTRIENSSFMNIGINNFGIYEKHLPAVNLNNISVTEDPRIVNDKLVLPSVPEGYELEFLGADYEQIIGDDLTIHRPLVGMNVNVSYQIMNSVTRNRLFQTNNVITKRIFVAGSNEVTAGGTGNPKPNILTEISEWYSNTNENLTIKNNAKVNFVGTRNAEVDSLLKILQNEYFEITKRELLINFEPLPTDLNGEIIIDLSETNIPGYDDETYGITIDNNVKIKAASRNGALWGTRTLLQILQLSDSKNMMPKGKLKDYPKYKIRGLSYDVARKPVSLETLKLYVKELSWRKLNQFQVHLSDNYIWLEHYRNDKKAFDTAVAAWRLESSIRNEAGDELTTKDYHYTKEEFAEFVKFSKEYGVEIVPELGVPAHSLSFTRLFPEFALEGRHGPRSTKDHIDIRKPEAVDKIIELFDDYINPGGIFADGKTTIHIGADEFTPPHGHNHSEFVTAYYNFLQRIFKHFTDRNVKVGLWGSASSLNYNDATTAYVDEALIRKVKMSVWSIHHANPDLAYNLGYKIVNSVDSLYVVPAGSLIGGRGNGYSDRVNIHHIYNNWEVNKIVRSTLPAGSKQLEGSTMALWADNLSDKSTSGLNEVDTFARFQDTVNYFAVKVWGNGNNGNDLTFDQYTRLAEKLNDVPTSNPYFKSDVMENRNQFFKYDFSGKNETEKLFDKSGNYGFISDLVNSTIQSSDNTNYLELNGGNSHAKLPVKILGLDNSLKFRIKRLRTNENQDDEIIFSGKWAYGDFSIKAKQKHTENFGISREGLDYYFDYVLPFDEWVDIEIQNPFNKNRLAGRTKLFVNGIDKGIARGKVFRDGGFLTWRATDNTLVFDNSTFFLPLDSIGSQNNSFKGSITNISVQPITPKMTMNTEEKEEFNRLSTLSLALNATPNIPFDELQPNQIMLSGSGDTETIRVIPETLKRDAQNDLINVQVERVSSRMPNVKFISNMILFNNTRLPDVLKSLETFRAVEEFSLYSEKSEQDYKLKLNNILSLSRKKWVSDEEFSNFEALLNQIPTILKGASEDAAKFFDLETINEDEYTSQSVTKRQEILNSNEYRTLEQKFKTTPQMFNRNDLKSTSDLVTKGNSQLVKNKKFVESFIRSEAQKNTNKTIYSSQSKQDYMNKVNELLAEVEEMQIVTRTITTDFQNRTNLLLSLLVTLKSIISKRLENLKNSVDNKYTTESLKNFNNEVSGIKQTIDNSETVNINDFDRLNQRILRANTLLETIKNSLLNEIHIKVREVKNSDFYQEKSAKKYLSEMNLIIKDLESMPNISDQQKEKIDEKIEKMNLDLVTYHKLIITKLNDLHGSLSSTYTLQSRRVARDIISKIRVELNNKPRINKMEYDVLDERIDTARASLVLARRIESPRITPPVVIEPVVPIRPPVTVVPITPDAPTTPVISSPVSPATPLRKIDSTTQIFYLTAGSAIGGLIVIMLLYVNFLSLKKKKKLKKLNKK